MIFLRDAERTQLKAQHRRERDGRVRDRIKAVLLCDKGWSIAAIAEALLLSEDAVREHINTYYPEFEDFKLAVFGFFTTLSMLAAESVLGQDFRSRVRDKFSPVNCPRGAFM